MTLTPCVRVTQPTPGETSPFPGVSFWHFGKKFVTPGSEMRITRVMMDYDQFRALVKKMLDVQRMYFQTRDQGRLIEAKNLEQEVRRELGEAGQGRLFTDQPTR